MHGSESLKESFSCRQCLASRRQHWSGVEASLALSHPQPGQEGLLLLAFQLQAFGLHSRLRLRSNLGQQEKMTAVHLTCLHLESNSAHLRVSAFFFCRGVLSFGHAFYSAVCEFLLMLYCDCVCKIIQKISALRPQMK